MTKLFPSRSGSCWRSDWLSGVLLVIVIIVLQLATDFPDDLERRLYDFASTTTARQPSDRIALIAIDDQSIASIGPWPWPRDIDARLIDQLTVANAKVIVHTGFFFEPQGERGLSFIRRIKDALADAGPPGDASSYAMHRQLIGLVAEAQTALDTDGRLVDSVRKAGNVIIPTLVAPGQTPIESLAAAAGVGHLNQWPDVDGVVRHETLTVNDHGKIVPSVALLAAAKSLSLNAADIGLNAGESVQVGTLRIKTDGAARVLPQFYPERRGQPPFATDSFADVLSGKIPASNYTNKIVVIGVTAVGRGQPFAAPVHPALSSAEAVAHVTSSILRQHNLVQPRWGIWATLGVLLLVAAYLIAAVPRLSAGKAIMVTGLLSAALLGAEFLLLSLMGLWLKLVFPAAFLMLGHLARALQPFWITDAQSPRPNQDSAETSRMMGLALQGQGQLDMAFDRYRQVPFGKAVLGNLQSLAHNFERKQQFHKAQTVYQYMATQQGGDADLKGLPPRMPSRSVVAQLAAGSRTQLGRYQLERELGKGAMGVVYLGKDPKIGRFVAIKTLALSEEFEGAALEDARQRFFREAETAGRLQHQNIVTMFDAGEAHDLAYIAMEFLKGKDLMDYCKAGQLLPVPTVLSIVARVAEALAYAHRQQVVHRDIKPANVMFDIGSDTVKVTDFGIARITDSSKTRTGLVLGTPSFMSPEQLVGKKVDGRSDLFSLGVMLFQLLTGVLPFRGESMAELMLKIANEDAPDIRSLRPELPQQLASVVAVLLSKNPQERYQEGDRLAHDLRAVLSGGNAIDVEI